MKSLALKLIYAEISILNWAFGPQSEDKNLTGQDFKFREKICIVQDFSLDINLTG